MDNKEIIEFQEKAIAYFTPILLEEGYEVKQAQDLAFYISKVLEDAFPLLKCIDKNESEVKEVMNKIHLFFTNLNALQDGKKILMWETTNL